MKSYSERLFQEFEDLSTQKEQLEIELQEKEKIYEIFKKVDDCDSDIKKYCKNIESSTLKLLIEMANLNYIARQLNNYSFEQYLECFEKYSKIKSKFLSELKKLNDEYKSIVSKLQMYEYAYELGLPIDDESLLEKITDPDLLELIVNENINSYTNTKEKEKQLVQKLEELNLSNDLKEIILEVNSIVNTSLISIPTDELIRYILSMSLQELNEYLDQNLFKCDDNVIFGVLKKIIDNINEPKSVIVLKSIYDKYIKNQKDEYESNIVEHPTIINLVKPNGNGFYIDDDIDVIESIPLVKRVKKQAEELESGNLSGKPIKYMSVKGLLEKKDFKVRTTYKVLSNNIVVIINCYIKGTNEAMRTRQRTKSVEYQIKLYEALADGDDVLIDRTIAFIHSHSTTSKEEIETYKKNFAAAVLIAEKRRSK